MRLNAGTFPDACHHHATGPQVSGQLPTAPVGRTIRGRFPRPVQNPARRALLHSAATLTGVQSAEPVVDKTASSTGCVREFNSGGVWNA
jgi:hypothetical protein